MIASLRGTVQSKESDSVVIDVAGVGYQVFVTQSLLQQFGQGDEVFIYTYQHVREDAILLYGFSQKIEKELFLLLQNVSGIGPKASMGILNSTTVGTFAKAIQKEDLTYLLELPGVGKKTAQRLVLELKEKLPIFNFEEDANLFDTKQTKSDARFEQDVTDTLSALGYSDKEIRETLKQLQAEEPLEDDVQAWVKAALRLLTRL